MGAMETYTSLVPLLVILVSLTAVPLIVAFGNRPNIREAWTLGAAVVKFLLVFSLLPAVLDGRVAEIVLMDISPNLQLALRADTLGLFFALLASGLWLSLIHISEPTRRTPISYAVFCLKKKKKIT